MQWFEQLGFSHYPLDARSNPNLVGVDDLQSRLVEYIQQGNMCLVSGFTGSGKTSMLQRIQHDPRLSEFRFIYISADGVKKGYDINDAIKDARSFVELITFKKPKKLVVLLDESHLANRILTESIKSKWNFVYSDGTKMIQSVVISQIESKLGTNFSGSFIDRLGHRVIQMRRLSYKDLGKVLDIRLHNGKKNYADYFSKEGRELLTKSVEGSVRQLFEYTDSLFRRLCAMQPNPFSQQDFSITKSIVFNLLQEAGLSVYSDTAVAKEGVIEKLLSTKRFKDAIDVFEQFGTISPVILAEKLDTSYKNAQKLLKELENKDAIIYSHSEDNEKFYILTPRLKHELVKQ